MRISLLALVLANLVPLAGVLFLGWSTYEVFALYWSENLVVGAFTVLRLFALRPAGEPLPLAARAGTALFFCVHYGLFLVVHGIFVVVFVGLGDRQGPLVDPSAPWSLLESAALTDGGAAMLALVASHGVSFIANFLLGGERTRLALGAVMIAPYPRIVPMHLALIAGGICVMFVGSTTPMLAVLVLLKTAADAVSHLREHAPKGAAAPPTAVAGGS